MVAVPEELSPEHVASLARDLLEAMPGGVVHVRADGSIAAANVEALELLGLDHDQLGSRYSAHFESGAVWEDGSACAAADSPVARALATGLPQPAITIGVRRPDGSLRWAVFRATPIKNAAARTTAGVIVTFLDVTERKRIEEELRGSRELLRKSQALAKIGSARWNVKTGEVSWNHDMWKVGGQRAVGSVSDLEAGLSFVHEDDRERLAHLAAEALAGRSMLGPTEARIRKLDGTEAVLWIWAEVVLDGSGRTQHIDVAVQDVTERRRLEEQLRRVQRMETVGRLASGVAHDFNNLLQAILANVEIGRRSGKGQEALARIDIAARRAADLTRKLLTLGSRQTFRRERVQAADLLGSLLELLPALLGEGISVEHELSEGLAAIDADPGLLQQALVNVCINARDAMPNGGRLIVRVCEAAHLPVGALHDEQARDEQARDEQARDGQARDGQARAGQARDEQARAGQARDEQARGDQASSPAQYVAISVQDSGHGIPTEVQARMFEPFFTTKQEGRGSGLGLAVVHGIIQQHRGAVHVESSRTGTRMTLFLPAAMDDAEGSRASRDSSLHPPAPVTDRPRPSCVLVVDDEPSVQRVVVQMLAEEGYDVLCASDGASAERLFAEHAERIDLLLTDIDMPHMTGIELARRLRAQHRGLRVIFTTGDGAAAASISPRSVLCKPFEMQELLDRVHSAIGARARSQ